MGVDSGLHMVLLVAAPRATFGTVSCCIQLLLSGLLSGAAYGTASCCC